MSRTCHNCQRRFNGVGFSHRFCGQPCAFEHHNKLLMNQKTSRQNDLATFLAYLKFCRQRQPYHDCIANQLRILDWVDERRIEMRAEGRPHWVPTEHDFWHAIRDCWDDLVKPCRLGPEPA
jgi:hypothetical protein